MKSIKLFIKYMLVFYIVIASIYWILIRPQHISWGATASEINRKIPGAELISSNSVFSTRAININAAKEKNMALDCSEFTSLYCPDLLTHLSGSIRKRTKIKLAIINLLQNKKWKSPFTIK